jgi:replicative DNA helicase
MGELLESGERDIPVWSLDEQLRLVPRTMTHVFRSGVKEVFRLKLASGREIEATSNHPFLTYGGWTPLGDLGIGSRVAVPRRLDAPAQAALGTRYCGSTLYKASPSRTRLSKVAEVLECEKLELLATSDVFWDQVVSVETLGEQEVYDATVLGTHNFIANGIHIHNSIEQDADMVILLHREDAYEKESPRAGEADLVVAKHRNGPTATITVAFQGHYSRFVDMAQT